MNQSVGIQTKIDVDELRSELESGSLVTVLDVRTVKDRAEWSIPGSLHFDAYEALKAGDPNALSRLQLRNDRPVVTVCVAGNTSLVAAEQLRKRGYDARSLVGGMKAWSLAWNTAEVQLSAGTVRVIQLRRTGKGCLSYLVSDGDQAVVIDPSLEPDVYEDQASLHGSSITYVVETHVHADHLSRGRVLAERTGAELHLPQTDRVAFPCAPLRDGDTILFGGSILTAVRTPGHTSESTSYLLNETTLFTGDTIFLTGVGRPDLEAGVGEARERAHTLWSSLHRVMSFPDETLVLPGHTSGPIAFDEQPITARLRDVTANVEMLHLDEAEFVERILSRIPQTPPNHSIIVALNESGESAQGDPTDLEAGANRCAVS